MANMARMRRLTEDQKNKKNDGFRRNRRLSLVYAFGQRPPFTPITRVQIPSGTTLNLRNFFTFGNHF
jgi:hypothetical protein